MLKYILFILLCLLIAIYFIFVNVDVKKGHYNSPLLNIYNVISLIEQGKRIKIYNLDFLTNKSKRKCNELNEQEKILYDLGAEFKENYPIYRKKFIFKYIIGEILLIVFLILLMRFWEHAKEMQVYLIIGLVFCVLLISLNETLKEQSRNLKEDNVTIGEKYKYRNKKVKGSHKNTFKYRIGACFLLLFLSISSFLFPRSNQDLVHKKIVTENELTSITGTFQYYREVLGDEGYIAIGLNEMDCEYRIKNTFNRNYFDFSFKEEIKKGDTIVLSIDQSKDYQFSSVLSDKTKWNYFYVLSTELKDYYSYNNYQEIFNKLKKEQLEFFCFARSIFILSIVASGISFIIYKKGEKKEIIEV